MKAMHTAADYNTINEMLNRLHAVDINDGIKAAVDAIVADYCTGVHMLVTVNLDGATYDLIFHDAATEEPIKTYGGIRQYLIKKG